MTVFPLFQKRQKLTAQQLNDALLAIHADAVAQALASVAPLTSGSPDALNTFLETYNRFLANEGSLATLTSLIGQKIATSQRGNFNGVAALDGNAKIDMSQIYAGTANGVATLDGTGKVPTTQLPTLPVTLPARLGEVSQPITDWNAAIASGTYQTTAAASDTNAPNAGWFLGVVEVAHVNYLTQTLTDFSAANSVNSFTWRRHRIGGVWGAWYKLQLTQAEQDARYAQLGLPNSFLGPVIHKPNASSSAIELGWSSATAAPYVVFKDSQSNYLAYAGGVPFTGGPFLFGGPAALTAFSFGKPIISTGTIEAGTGGFKFPDGTTQTTAATTAPSPIKGVAVIATATGAWETGTGVASITRHSSNDFAVTFATNITAAFITPLHATTYSAGSAAARITVQTANSVRFSMANIATGYDDINGALYEPPTKFHIVAV